MSRCLSLVVLTLAVIPAAAEDWPQWLGPRRDGSSSEKVAPWKEAPKVLWRVPVGEGHSSPVVAGGKVFLHTKVKGKDAEQVTAYNLADGKEAWSESYERGKFTSDYGVGPRSTPSVVDGKLYTLGVTGILTCWDAASGKTAWKVDTQKDFSPPALYFGVSCSPLVEGDKLLVNVGAKGASVVAFDRSSGNVKWKALDDGASYSSPIAFGEGKSRQVVFLTAKGLRSLSPTDGTLFWDLPLVDLLLESSTTPVRVDDFLLASSVTFGSLGATLKYDPKPAATQAWKNPALTCYFSTPVPVGKDHLYMVTGSLLRTSTLRCVEWKTGKELWKKDRVAKDHAALVRTADDRLLMLDDFGNLKLLDPNSKEYRELATAKVCKQTWAHPALCDGKLILRDEAELICLQLR